MIQIILAAGYHFQSIQRKESMVLISKKPLKEILVEMKLDLNVWTSLKYN